MVDFAPAVMAPAGAERDAAWLVFQGGEMRVEGGRALHDSPGGAPARSLYLGTLDGRHVFAAEVAGASGPFLPLRAAYAAIDASLFGVVATAAQLLHWDRTTRFCASCAAPLGPHRNDRAKVCAACDIHYFPRISPAVIVLVHDGDRVLLTHKPRMPFHALVAGFLEAGETLEECAAREIREETAVEIDQLRYFGSQPWPFPHQVMIGFFARYASGEARPDNHEIDEAAWFDVRALPPIPPRISIARRLIDAYCEERGANQVR